MEERVSSTSPRRNTGVMLWTKLKAILHSEVRNSICRMKYMYLQLAIYSNSVYISGKPWDRTTKCIPGMYCRICYVSL